MSTLTENVTLTIRVDTVGLALAGFGVPMVLSTSPTWVERSRTYEGLSDVSADFAAGTPEYLTAQALFSQEPHPEQLVIGRGSNKATQSYAIGVVLAANLQPYAINLIQPGATVVNPVTFTTDSSGTVPEIANGLVNALNAVSGKNYTATFGALTFTNFTFTASSVTSQATATAHGLNTGDGPIQVSNSGGALPGGLATVTNYWVIKIDANTFEFATSLANALAGTLITLSSNGTGTQTVSHVTGTLSPSLPFVVTGNAAGNWFSLEITDPTLLTNAQTHADPGVAADLTAIQLQNDSWYALHTLYNSTAYVLAAAAWIEAQSKIYLVDVCETQAITVAVGSSPTDTAFQLFGHAYNRTACSFYPSPGAMMSAAWLGRVLPDDPGSETWDDKSLAGIVATTYLTATHRVNLRARKCNFYPLIGGVGATQDGTIAGGTFGFIDVTRGLDWLEDDMTKAVMSCLLANEKIPFTNAGIAVIRSVVKASLKRAVAAGVISDDFVITVPDISDISDADKALRNLPDVKWSATLTGAIQLVKITGVVSF